MNIAQELSNPGKRVAGLKQVMRYARQAMLEKVYIACDADEDIINRVLAECAKHGIPSDNVYTMHQIGSACGIDVGSACAGVLKSGQ
ncbi:MAG: ribosomal L7Ae/L30e/S12e/Gadd45 family protein [Christensenellales bacterium]